MFSHEFSPKNFQDNAAESCWRRIVISGTERDPYWETDTQDEHIYKYKFLILMTVRSER